MGLKMTNLRLIELWHCLLVPAVHNFQHHGDCGTLRPRQLCRPVLSYHIFCVKCMYSKWTLIYWLMRVRYGVQFVNLCLVFVQPSSLSCYIQYYIILNNDILEFNYKIILFVTNHSMISHQEHINGLVQDCSISSALAMEILQSCTKPLAWSVDHVFLAPYMVQIYSTDYHKVS